MVDFTVAIPTYNGEYRLPAVLEALALQIKVDNLSWEILVVDNNSLDRTVEVVRRYQHVLSAPIRCISELRQGAAFARDRAVREAQSDWIGFLDDDNIPAPDWVSAAYQFAQRYPKAGAFASRIYADFEAAPPENFERIVAFLAITQRGSKPLLYVPHRRLLPPSAGLVVRKQTWLACVPSCLILSGRVEGNMLTGEDTEMLSYIQQSGWEIWYNPEMVVKHRIPKHRLEWDYLIPFFRGIGLSRHVTRMLSIKPWLRPVMIVVHCGNDLRKVVLHVLKYRLQIRTDLVAACEMELFLSSLISPFYLWRNGYLRFKKPDYAPQHDIEVVQG